MHFPRSRPKNGRPFCDRDLRAGKPLLSCGRMVFCEESPVVSYCSATMPLRPSLARRPATATSPIQGRGGGHGEGSVLLGVPGRGDVIGVFLRIAFRHQEAVVAAA